MYDIIMTVVGGLIVGGATFAFGREIVSLRRDLKAIKADVATRAKSRGKRGAAK